MELLFPDAQVFLASDFLFHQFGGLNSGDFDWFKKKAQSPRGAATA